MLYTKPIGSITYQDVVDFCCAQHPEGFILEYKEAFPAPADLAKSIAAFANTSGGLLIIGVKAPSGLPVAPHEGIVIGPQDKFEERVENIILDHLREPVFPEIHMCPLTTVPTAWGFWLPWLPWALPQRWPFCWWVGVVVDHFSRRIMGAAVFAQNPTSVAIRQFLGHVIAQTGGSPTHLITHHGTQFTDEGFRVWCQRRGIRQRFGAVGKYGSIAVVERLIRTLKAEALRCLLVPLHRKALSRELGLFVEWYNGHRPHSSLEAATPDELYFHRKPAAHSPRFEPRRHWPRASPCAAPQAAVRGRRGQYLELNVTYLAGRRHLPIIELKKAA